MKELKKIKFLNDPKSSVLSGDEQSQLLGGATPRWTCVSYITCGLFKKSDCGEWGSGSCNGTSVTLAYN